MADVATASFDELREMAEAPANRDAERLLRKKGWLDVQVYAVFSDVDCSCALFIDRRRGEESPRRAYIRGRGERCDGHLLGVADGWGI